jgi:hypothetical protein
MKKYCFYSILCISIYYLTVSCRYAGECMCYTREEVKYEKEGCLHYIYEPTVDSGVLMEGSSKNEIEQECISSSSGTSIMWIDSSLKCGKGQRIIETRCSIRYH